MHLPKGGEGGVEQRLYPLGITCVNLVTRLAALVGVGRPDAELAQTQGRAWGMFESHTGFFELFMVALLFLDAMWARQEAGHAQFGQVLDTVAEHVQVWLEAGPSTVGELKEIVAREEGVSL